MSIYYYVCLEFSVTHLYFEDLIPKINRKYIPIIIRGFLVDRQVNAIHIIVIQELIILVFCE